MCLGGLFCAKCKENRFQSTGARTTAKTTSQETIPATCKKTSISSIFLPKVVPTSLQNHSRGLSEAAGAPRRTQKQQTATKKTPRAPQERPKAPGSDFHDFPGPRRVPILDPSRVADRAWRPGFEAPGLGSLEWRFRVDGVLMFLVSEGPQKMASSKPQLKL